jgi:hypothetical protein
MCAQKFSGDAGDVVLEFIGAQLRDDESGWIEAATSEFLANLAAEDREVWEEIGDLEWTGNIDSCAAQFSEKQLNLCREYVKWLDSKGANTED